jgi:septal ring factor EnvC (AmiA/AmiB activator)
VAQSQAISAFKTLKAARMPIFCLRAASILASGVRIALRQARLAAVAAIVLVLTTAAIGAQLAEVADPEAQARRINERIRALQSEAARLAGEASTLVGELRKLEIERDLRAEEARQADRALADARAMLEDTTSRVTVLEQERSGQLPDLEARLVDVYKRGRTGYARLLFGVDNLREFARATRAVAALAEIDARRLAEHRNRLDALRKERAAIEATTRELEARDAAARRARAAAERAVAAHGALIARIDSRRDVNAQYVGELQAAYDRLQQQVAAMGSDAPATSSAAPAAPPLTTFRSALEWPAEGDVTGRFGQTSGRLGGTAVRNGIEVAVAEGTPVRAVHGGVVGFAGPFTGFGNLVIVNHGDENYSLYGYLESASVAQGAMVDAGAELGRVGRAPAGPPALYFEMRIDGRSVDPLQWLKRP